MAWQNPIIVVPNHQLKPALLSLRTVRELFYNERITSNAKFLIKFDYLCILKKSRKGMTTQICDNNYQALYDPPFLSFAAEGATIF